MSLRRVLLGIVIVIAALPMLGLAALLIELSYRPAYDRSHPDYQHYADLFDRLSTKIARNGITNEDAVDLSQLNAGAWKMACLFGGYTDPLQDMYALGANISPKDQIRLTESGSRGFRLGPVEETEMPIAYVDLENNANFIHFERGFGPEGQHFKRCIPRSEARLPLGFLILQRAPESDGTVLRE
jgi:hypothetical protein